MSSTANNKKIIGLCQMLSSNDKTHNRQQVNELFQRSKGKAEFLFLPECCDYVGCNVEETLRLAEPLTGETVNFYKQLCKDYKMWASFGGIHETSEESKGKLFNTHVIVNSEGEIASIYRKLHLFDVDTPDFKFRESKIIQAGTGVVEPLESPIGKIGLQICYDIRFPESPIWLKKQGAQIITYPSAFAVTTGKAHWDILNRSRAIENQCFIISSAQQGKHNEKRSSYGQAIAVSPWGDIIGRCTQELEVQFVEIDLEKIVKVETNMPCFQHRRNDVYSLDVKTSNYLSHVETKSIKSFVFEKYPVDSRTIFYESENCVAFTNIRCVVPGHVS
jgi:deaminated glutathione amidase